MSFFDTYGCPFSLLRVVSPFTRALPLGLPRYLGTYLPTYRDAECPVWCAGSPAASAPRRGMVLPGTSGVPASLLDPCAVLTCLLCKVCTKYEVRQTPARMHALHRPAWLDDAQKTSQARQVVLLVLAPKGGRGLGWLPRPICRPHLDGT